MLRAAKEQQIAQDFSPVISAWNKGFRRIAEERFQRICKQKSLVYWETSVISREVIRPRLNGVPA